MPAKEYSDSIKTVNFVYETELKKFNQPFLKPIYIMNLVTRGKGTMSCEGNSFYLETGCIFFNFPGVYYEIQASDDFEFAYISFMGDCVDTILKKISVSPKNAAFAGFGHITEMWLSSLRRLDEFNSNILTEGVLLYTLSFFGKKGKNTALTDKNNMFSGILDYVDKHLTDPEMSLRRVSGIFAYTQKYFSHLFKNNAGVGFCEYINEKRMNYALSLIEKGETEVSRISELCGFTDPLYFSKVFKKHTGTAPRTYINNKSKTTNGTP